MFGGVFDSAAIEKAIAEKEKLTEAPGFWDDHEAAEKVMSQIRKLKNRIEPWKKIIADMDDLEAMYELAAESGEASDEDEVRSMYEAAKAQFDKLNILNLLSGEVDQNDAFLTVHAGAGGTEACDWAFMLSRMYLRWAERHGYKTEVMDELEAEGGLKSITIQISGDFAKGEKYVLDNFVWTDGMEKIACKLKKISKTLNGTVKEPLANRLLKKI